MLLGIANFFFEKKKCFNALKLCVGSAVYKKNTNSATKFNTLGKNKKLHNEKK